MAEETLEKLEEQQFSEVDEEVILPPSDIVAFNESRSCAEFVRMYNDKELDIQPEFQRNVVWQTSEQTRFIDSLIKQLPIPSLCLGYDRKQEKRIVIDGLQRITSIVNFLKDGNDSWRLSRLSDVSADISGKSIAEIKRENYQLITRVRNVTIPVTVLMCDLKEETHLNYLFTIFHRLNTGGQRLNNQEIRNCIYSGSFNDLLKEIANSDAWKNLFNRPKKDRFVSEEILLRTFAFIDKLNDYKSNLARFLNHYMKEKQHIDENEIQNFRNSINDTLSLIDEKISNKQKIKENFGRTLQEGLLVGIVKNIEHLKPKTSNEINVMFDNFCNAEEFSEANIRQSLAEKTKVQSRLNKSIEIFGQ
jgi:hypothetical protein